jgi:hypothetical protein
VPGAANAGIKRQEVAELTISQKLLAIREATTTATKTANEEGGENTKVAWSAILILASDPNFTTKLLCFGSSSDSTIQWAFSMI